MEVPKIARCHDKLDTLRPAKDKNIFLHESRRRCPQGLNIRSVNPCSLQHNKSENTEMNSYEISDFC